MTSAFTCFASSPDSNGPTQAIRDTCSRSLKVHKATRSQVQVPRKNLSARVLWSSIVWLASHTRPRDEHHKAAPGLTSNSFNGVEFSGIVQCCLELLQGLTWESDIVVHLDESRKGDNDQEKPQRPWKLSLHPNQAKPLYMTIMTSTQSPQCFARHFHSLNLVQLALLLMFVSSDSGFGVYCSSGSAPHAQ